MSNTDFALAVEDLTVSFDGFKAIDALHLYIDKNELRNGLKLLAKKGYSSLDKAGIEEDLLHIMRYIDEDSSDSVEAHELSAALKKARRHTLEGDEDMKQLQNFGG